MDASYDLVLKDIQKTGEVDGNRVTAIKNASLNRLMAKALVASDDPAALADYKEMKNDEFDNSYRELLLEVGKSKSKSEPKHSVFQEEFLREEDYKWTHEEDNNY